MNLTVALTKPINLTKRVTLTADDKVRHGVPHDCTARHRRLVSTDSPSLAEPFDWTGDPIGVALQHLFDLGDVHLVLGNVEITALADCDY